ncbi:MAG: hypothetical protein KJ890_16580 [Gammaproteobacteria bacterium]|nr:hypothetical protein [Gammaproteobacteria bacterium]MBU0789194.1 hypothetical protein [Gammaproteobacteria bacterium]MBU1803600.1 hypothetical protein [Gammaproteobacteria bacterium]
MKLHLWVICASAAILAGCGEPKLDGSSEQAMQQSVEKVSSKLEPGKQAEFKEALQVVAFSKMDLGALMKGEQTPDGAAGTMLSELDGKTAGEVIVKAASIKAERAAREKEQALREIAELEALTAKAEEAKAQLAKFEVSRSRFYLRDREYSYRKEPIVELAVRNGTEHPISRAYFKGTISSPGRSIPWLIKDFNYTISGGLEPGEAQEWELAPNMFSDWGKVDAPEDALFTVEVVRLDGPDSKALFDARGLSDSQAARLQKLKVQYQ